ncbi:MFS transporter [Conexibacter arvalis]|uniref:EmrB/QacA subfamily drug resistance transporter n=1 Tax=Conexibacter arvalis TaxID=912552 RepID=A0A840IA65_9ACTN|nr:MFS transporter [Conexibacter arvalis]MBB4661133.1 EmrB/QacA subfamily drug resistance transporter [Conexibacter arvalis]
MPALILLCAAQFMVILDITVVSIAMPSIQQDLGFAIADLQWVVTAYTLAFGGLLLLGGRAADLLGRRRVFLTGLTVFTGASLGAALAGSPTALLAARACQGVGAAMLSPAALSLVTTAFPDGPQRRRALAAWAAVAASGGAFGVLAGGLLTETLDWTAIFLVNVPIGIAVGIGALRLLPVGGGASPSARGPIDVAGALLATGGLVALIYGLVEAPGAGWGSLQTIGLLALAAAALTTFVAVEARVRQPLVTLSVFRRRPTTTALVLMVAGMGTILSTFFFLTLYLQHVLGHSALRSGLEFLPGALLLVLAAHAGGQLTARLGAKPVLAGGMTLAALGALLLSGVSPGGSYLADVLPGLLVLDLGVGLAASAIFIVGMSGVGDEEAGMVSGLLSTAHELGGALVLPVLSTIAVSGVGAATLDAASGLDPVLATKGFGDAFRAAAAIALAAALLALAALRRSDVATGTPHAFAH